MAIACDPFSKSSSIAHAHDPHQEEKENRFFLEWNTDVSRSAAKLARAAGLRNVAEDLAQETRLHLLRLFRTRRLPSKAYARRVVSNSVRKARSREVRHRSRFEPLTLGQQGMCAPTQDTDIMVREVSQWLAGLPRRMREVYDLIYRREHTQRSAAVIMGLSQPRVAQLNKQLLRRGVLDLANRIA